VMLRDEVHSICPPASIIEDPQIGTADDLCVVDDGVDRKYVEYCKVFASPAAIVYPVCLRLAL